MAFIMNEKESNLLMQIDDIRKESANECVIDWDEETMENTQNVIREIPGSEFNLTYKTEVYLQARWHKKKRINKKWVKRYGYRYIPIGEALPVVDIDLNHMRKHTYVEFVVEDKSYHTLERRKEKGETIDD